MYTRQSVKTESDLTSCDVQREMCLQFLRSQQRDSLQLIALDDRFDDEGRSGANANRPALQRMLGLIRAGVIQAVVIQRLDRLSRKVADSARLLHQFKKHGVRLFIVAMPELAASAHDTFMLNMLAAFAEFERDMIADRIRDARASLVVRGQRIAGVVPYGYSAHPTTKQLIAVAEEASIVRQLFELVADGIPPSEAARIAAEKGWRTRSGRRWTARQVLDTVSNPVYSGRFRAGKKNESRSSCADHRRRSLRALRRGYRGPPDPQPGAANATHRSRSGAESPLRKMSPVDGSARNERWSARLHVFPLPKSCRRQRTMHRDPDPRLRHRGNGPVCANEPS